MNIHKGIEASIKDSLNVTSLFIEAKEADEFFYWSKASAKAAIKLKQLFPNLEIVTIEDDYLLDSQIDALMKQLRPLIIKWVHRAYVDGRHGR